MHPGHYSALLMYPFPGWRLASTAVLMVACMIGVGWLARDSWLGVAVLAGLSLAWVNIDGLWEVMLLFGISGNHGVTLTDLVGAAGIAASLGLALRLYRGGLERNRAEREVRIAVEDSEVMS